MIISILAFIALIISVPTLLGCLVIICYIIKALWEDGGI